MKKFKNIIATSILLASIAVGNNAVAAAYDIKLQNCGASQAQLSFKVDGIGGLYYVLPSHGTGDTGGVLATSLFPWKGTLFGTTINTFVVIVEHETGEAFVAHCS